MLKFIKLVFILVVCQFSLAHAEDIENPQEKLKFCLEVCNEEQTCINNCHKAYSNTSTEENAEEEEEDC